MTQKVPLVPRVKVETPSDHYRRSNVCIILLQALIVPAFEQVRESAITTPGNKPALLEMWEEKAIKPFQ